MIRVLIAEDHGVVRAGLEQLLGGFPDVEVVASAANGEDAVSLAVERRPDVVLMDLQMPELDGIEATRRVKEALPETSVVVLTSFSDRDRILRALDAGAIGYLLKDAEPEDLLAGIRAAASGDAPLAPRVAHVVLTARTRTHPLNELSERELEVLALLGQGLPNKLIARQLAISEKTVKAHLTQIYRTLGVSDRTQAALLAREHGALERQR